MMCNNNSVNIVACYGFRGIVASVPCCIAVHWCSIVEFLGNTTMLDGLSFIVVQQCKQAALLRAQQ
jgi:hypothetical protein